MTRVANLLQPITAQTLTNATNHGTNPHKCNQSQHKHSQYISQHLFSSTVLGCVACNNNALRKYRIKKSKSISLQWNSSDWSWHSGWPSQSAVGFKHWGCSLVLSLHWNCPAKQWNGPENNNVSARHVQEAHTQTLIFLNSTVEPTLDIE